MAWLWILRVQAAKEAELDIGKILNDAINKMEKIQKKNGNAAENALSSVSDCSQVSSA